MTRSLLPDAHPILVVTDDTAQSVPPGTIVATDSEHLIRAWAEHHGAEPATGEATSSGPATVHVQDGDSGIRFNFPAAARFRPISWDEWLRNLRDHDLMFVYEQGASAADTTYRTVPRQRISAIPAS